MRDRKSHRAHPGGARSVVDLEGPAIDQGAGCRWADDPRRAFGLGQLHPLMLEEAAALRRDAARVSD